MSTTRKDRWSWMKGGFGLIELIVVVAITAVLVALLIPTFSHVREVNNLGQCSSRLRTLGQVNMLYVADHGGYKIPFYNYWPETGGVGGGWYDHLWTYYGRQDGPAGRYIRKEPNQIFWESPLVCPSDSNPYSGYRSYAISRYVGGYDLATEAEQSQYLRLNMQQSPVGGEIVPIQNMSTTAWFTETKAWNYFKRSQSKSNIVFNRHRGGFNVLFYDGRVERLNGRQLMDQPQLLLTPEWNAFWGM